MFGSSGRSSKTSKCKTQLKLVVSRIKLLRNKREIRVKHLRKDVAELLRNKQDANARTRAEYAIREQNMVDAFNLIEHYCDFLAGRIQSISGQKECPPELKEAIASLIYAAPRCADLPELLEIRSIFSAKFGKQFIATIVELRVGCGVSRKMIEKFSTQALSTEMKMTLMAEVAKEFGVAWKPEDLASPEEKRPQPPPVSGLSQPQEKKSQNGSPKSPLDETPPPSAKPRVAASFGAASELDDSNDDEEEIPSPVPSAKRVEQHAGPKKTHVPVARPVEPHSPASKQFIPFIAAQGQASPSPPDPYGQFNRNIMNPYAPQQAAVKAPEATDPYFEYKKKLIMNHSYVDVATAAEAAAKSADQAAAAARVAANMAHKQLSRESSMASDDVATSVASARAVKNVDGRRSTIVNLEERVASYVQAHANDTDSSEWETQASPLPNDFHRLNTSRNLFVEQRDDEKREEASRAAEQDDEQEYFRRQERRVSTGTTIRRNSHVASTEVFHTSENIPQHHDAGRPVFDDYHPSSKLGHQREDFEDLFDRKTRISEAYRSTSRSTNRLSYNGRRRKQDEGVFNTGPEISKRQEPETSYNDRFEKPVVFDEAPPSFSRLDSFTTNMETMHVNVLSRTEKLFEKEDSDDSPVESRRLRTRDKPASKLAAGDFEWQNGQDHEEPSSFDKKSYNPDFREEQHEAGTGRNAAPQKSSGSDWRSKPPSRSPPKLPEGKHLNFQQQFRGSGVDYTETSSAASARRYRFAGASVRTKKT